MELLIVCPSCQGAGHRIAIVGYAGHDVVGEMLVSRGCAPCAGTGRVAMEGWTRST